MKPESGIRPGSSAQIVVPQWICSPLGRHYRYFPDELTHQLRLAYADDPAGPWTIFRGFPLGLLAKVSAIAGTVDHDNHRIRISYRVETADGASQTCLASSTNGLRFRVESPEGTSPPERQPR
jgi:hypothetical protein